MGKTTHARMAVDVPISQDGQNMQRAGQPRMAHLLNFSDLVCRYPETRVLCRLRKLKRERIDLLLDKKLATTDQRTFMAVNGVQLEAQKVLTPPTTPQWTS